MWKLVMLPHAKELSEVEQLRTDPSPPLQRQHSPDDLDLEHLASRIPWDDTFPLFKPLNVWYFAMAALENESTMDALVV